MHSRVLRLIATPTYNDPARKNQPPSLIKTRRLVVTTRSHRSKKKKKKEEASCALHIFRERKSSRNYFSHFARETQKTRARTSFFLEACADVYSATLAARQKPRLFFQISRVKLEKKELLARA